jgi:hypothetical protein
MACPHVVGALALLKEAFPNFTGHELKMALYSTAQDLGAAGEDNIYGMGIIDVWAAFLSLGVPDSPGSFSAYSDYRTPTSMSLTWDDPRNLANGDTLLPGDITIHIKRDGVRIDSTNGGVEQFLDTGLVDGQEYVYNILVKSDSSGLQSQEAEASWIAGGSPIPSAAQSFSVAGNQNLVTLSWLSPRDNVDGTPMDDYAGVNLYQNGTLVTTFSRTSADTGIADSNTYSPSTSGLYEWYLTVMDNETPQNESDPTPTVGTPLSVPIVDEFTSPGDPNPGIWINSNTDVNDRAVNPPTGQHALNLNGKPIGEDIIDLKPLDLSGMQGTGIELSYYYQPQGTGNVPEEGDSLRLYFKNDLGAWLLVRAYPGSPVQPFQQEVIDIETAPNGGGTYFHGQISTGSSRYGFAVQEEWVLCFLMTIGLWMMFISMCLCPSRRRAFFQASMP